MFVELKTHTKSLLLNTEKVVAIEPSRGEGGPTRTIIRLDDNTIVYSSESYDDVKSKLGF